MERLCRAIVWIWRVILPISLLAGALLGCGQDEFTPPPATIIRATEGDSATDTPQPVAVPSTNTPAPKASPLPLQQSTDSYPRPTFAPVTPLPYVPYPSPQR
ncbi:MAG: hypothetical protein H5T69_01530 [Chloroflexi bacterium]|nr:hypothetical protein [Chloroflexota bacterium]